MGNNSNEVNLLSISVTMAKVGVLWHFAIKAVVSCNQGCSICNAAFTRISTAALINFSRLKCGAYSRAVVYRVNTVIVRLRNLKEKHTSEKSAKMLKKPWSIA